MWKQYSKSKRNYGWVLLSSSGSSGSNRPFPSRNHAESVRKQKQWNTSDRIRDPFGGVVRCGLWFHKVVMLGLLSLHDADIVAIEEDLRGWKGWEGRFAQKCDDYDKTDRCIRREYNNGQASSRLQHASSSWVVRYTPSGPSSNMKEIGVWHVMKTAFWFAKIEREHECGSVEGWGGGGGGGAGVLGEGW